MRFNSLLFFFLFISISGLFSQAGSLNDGFCKTSEISNRKLQQLPWYGNNQVLHQILDSAGYYEQKFDFENALYRVPVKLWIYRKNDGTGGLTEPEIKKMFQYLNHFNILNNTGFIYYLRPDITYIDKTKRTKLGYYIEKPTMTTFRREKKCINLHITNDIIIKRLFGSSRAIRGSYNKVNHGITLRKRSTPTTLTHEIGHFFGLLHPHRNFDKGKCKQEAVKRQRKYGFCLKRGLICEKSGDALCDTPAEHNLNSTVDIDCKYVGNEKDKWGDSYIPATRNIMSYPQSLRCREIFTKGQIAVMLHTAQKYNICEWTAKCTGNNNYKYQYHFDKYEPDDTQLMASEIKKDEIQHHTFHKVFMSNTDVDNNTDWLFFDIRRPAKVTISTASAKYRTADTEIFITDSNGKLLYTDDNSGTGNYSKIVIKKLTKGKYYIKVKMKNSVNVPDIADYNIELKTKELR